MALLSKLFRGDPKLEAAASSDPAHLVPGASGPHIAKIQSALNQLDGATLELDGSYGQLTATAVLAYKRKRSIVNRSTQSQADNIVGKMTMASLDDEMVKRETLPARKVQIKPTSMWRLSPPRSLPLLALLSQSEPTASRSIIGSNAVTAPTIVPGPSIFNPSINPTVILEMRRNSVGSFLVSDGAPGDVSIEDPTLARIAPDSPVIPGASALVITDPQTFKIFSGKTLGRTTIRANCLGATASIDVVVKTFLDPPTFVPGTNHAHKASGRYAEVKANPNNSPGFFGSALDVACQFGGPEFLVSAAKRLMFSDKPIALQHLDHYQTIGKGADFVEDANIKDWLTRDRGIRARLKKEIFQPHRKPKSEGHFTFDQHEYTVEDFHFAFGAIDRVDFRVDFSQDTVQVWFQDRYEWHPVYPFYSFVGPVPDFPTSGDARRETNCLHAALVELKSSGAADFWMKGQAEVPLSLIVRP